MAASGFNYLGFPREARIIKTDDFSSVFNFRKRISGEYLAIHYQPNRFARLRLGLIVGKKTARLSVDRNYMKRVLRELFRKQQLILSGMDASRHENLSTPLIGLDIVVRTQKPFSHKDYPLVQNEFLTLLDKLVSKIHRSNPAKAAFSGPDHLNPSQLKLAQ